MTSRVYSPPVNLASRFTLRMTTIPAWVRHIQTVPGTRKKRINRSIPLLANRIFPMWPNRGIKQ